MTQPCTPEPTTRVAAITAACDRAEPETNRSRGAAFTLVELLVVMALLALLLALLAPALRSARAKGQQMVCVNNLRQLFFACRQYANDFNDYIPHYATGDGSGDMKELLLSKGYIKQQSATYPKSPVLICPTAVTAPPEYDQDQKDRISRRCSYGVAIWVTYAPPFDHPRFVDWERRWPSPAVKVLVGELAMRISGGMYIFSNGGVQQGDPTTDWAISARHSGGANYLFFDGHVAYLEDSFAYARRNNLLSPYSWLGVPYDW